MQHGTLLHGLEFSRSPRECGGALQREPCPTFIRPSSEAADCQAQSRGLLSHYGSILHLLIVEFGGGAAEHGRGMG